jgi:hypothetical protein
MLAPALIPAILDAGYNFDFIDPEAISRLGIHYPILVIPPTDRIPAATLQSIQQYVRRGGKVISVGKVPSLSPEGKATEAIASLTKQLFNADNNSFVSSESELGSALRKAAIPDFDLSSSRDEIGFIRRSLPDADIYFIANTSNQPVTATATFSSRFQHVEIVDATSGEIVRGTKKDQPLELAPYESRVIILTDRPYIGNSSKNNYASLLDLSDNWRVHFVGTDKETTMEALTDWTSNPETKHYSGEAVYKRSFNLEAKSERPVYLSIEGGHPTTSSDPVGHPGMQAWYESPVREAAIVVINGKQAGYLWHPPYRLDITKLLKPGANQIELHVYNTALNAWSALPPHNYKPLIERYGDRFQMQDLNKVQATPSGILGSIRLLTAQ